jgi:hypothetical protein
MLNAIDIARKRLYTGTGALSCPVEHSSTIRDPIIRQSFGPGGGRLSRYVVRPCKVSFEERWAADLRFLTTDDRRLKGYSKILMISPRILPP